MQLMFSTTSADTSASTYIFQQTRQTVSVEATISVDTPFAPSPMALDVVHYVAASSRLSPSEKASIIRLAAIIDAYAAGDERLLSQLASVVQLMETSAKGDSYQTHSVSEAMAYYADARQSLSGRGESSFSLSVRAEFEQLTFAYRGISLHDALQRSGMGDGVDVISPQSNKEVPVFPQPTIKTAAFRVTQEVVKKTASVAVLA